MTDATCHQDDAVSETSSSWNLHGSSSHQPRNNHAGTASIVVGYVFGPKKMSTMGVVMAEASQAYLHDQELDDDARRIVPSPLALAGQQRSLRQRNCVDAPGPPPPLSELANQDDSSGSPLLTKSLSWRSYFDGAPPLATMPPPQVAPQPPAPSNSVVFTIDGQKDEGGLRNIVRYFQSSVSDTESTGTCTVSTSTTTQRWNSSNTSRGSNRTWAGAQPWPDDNNNNVRVSFVPLDPEQALAEQHNGVHVVLHKLTEDILLVSQLSEKHVGVAQRLASYHQGGHHNSTIPVSVAGTAAAAAPLLTREELAALHRVERLYEFQRQQNVCLVDDPRCVQTLMNRAAIAHKLSQCLCLVSSASGVPVGTPKYAMLLPGSNNVTRTLHDLRYPLIAKPLSAAGTKASHAMSIVLANSAASAQHLRSKTPCLVQEYANHDATLYKVYVLGNFVAVYKRRSLPNLPHVITEAMKDIRPFLAFDSQRPYPRLSDFGIRAAPTTTTTTTATDGNTRKRLRSPDTAVLVMTEHEVRPIVDALKTAFGLELFGFDILLTLPDDIHERRRMLVVDVNYFPSYKEVPDFPALLANFLKDKAMEKRSTRQI